MFKDTKEGQTNYCVACEAEANEIDSDKADRLVSEGKATRVPVPEHTCGKSYKLSSVKAYKDGLRKKVEEMSWNTDMKELKGQVFNKHHYVRVKNVNAKLLQRKSDMLALLSDKE